MRILGRTGLPKRTRSVTVGYDEKGKALEFIVRPVPYDVILDMKAKLPLPLPPSTGEVRRDRKGRPMKRDGQSIMIRDHTDPAYLEAVEVQQFIFSSALTLASLGDQVELRPKKEDEGWQAYYGAILTELDEAGLDLGVFARLSEACTSIGSALSTAEVLSMRQELGTLTAEGAEEEEQAAAEREALPPSVKEDEEGNVHGARCSTGS